MLAGLLMSAGLGPKAAKIGSYVILALLFVGALWWMRADAYADGERDTDAKWKLASAKLEQQAARAAGSADAPAAVRAEQFTQQVTVEKEKLDEAQRNGTSQLDVLFGPSGL
jgi:hypothetical protein